MNEYHGELKLNTAQRAISTVRSFQ